MASSPTSPTCYLDRLLSSPPVSKTRIPDTMAPLRSQTLSDNWQWKQRPSGHKVDVEVLTQDDGWIGTRVPTEIFKDLLDAGKIEDPHVDQVEKNVQWVGQVDWLYRTRFTVDHGPGVEEKAVLAFDGLDTFANVYLNGKRILKTEVSGCLNDLLILEYVS
jgi:beta-mannosidase